MSFSQGVGYSQHTHCLKLQQLLSTHAHTHAHTYTVPMTSPPFPALFFCLAFIINLPYMLLSYFVNLSPLLQGKCHRAGLFCMLPYQ